MHLSRHCRLRACVSPFLQGFAEHLGFKVSGKNSDLTYFDHLLHVDQIEPSSSGALRPAPLLPSPLPSPLLPSTLPSPPPPPSLLPPPPVPQLILSKSLHVSEENEASEDWEVDPGGKNTVGLRSLEIVTTFPVMK